MQMLLIALISATFATQAAAAGICVENASATGYVFVAHADDGTREVADLASGETLCSAGNAQGTVAVFASRGDRYSEISEEELTEANPSLVLLSSEPFPFSESHGDELAKTTGLPRERFLLVDGELLSWHGSQTLEGLRYAGRILG